MGAISAIVKLNITNSYFIGVANNCFDATTNKEHNLMLAERYWRNLPNKHKIHPSRKYEWMVRLRLLISLKTYKKGRNEPC